MKSVKKVFFMVLLIISLISNLLLSYFLYDNTKAEPSIIRFGFDEHNIEVYCEKSEDVKSVKIDSEEGSFNIGNAELISGEELLLISPDSKTNLSEIGGEAFIINSDGDILYQMMKPENQKEKSPEVFVAPSGEKYHSDLFCAGKRAFEISKETAELFGRRPCSKCF